MEKTQQMNRKATVKTTLAGLVAAIVATLTLMTGCVVESRRDGTLVFRTKTIGELRLDSLTHRARQGDPVAQFTLGSQYLRSGPAHYSEAVNWLTLSANQAYVRAQHRLGRCYELGRGVPRNYQQAKYWYRKAADQGDLLAQNDLRRFDIQPAQPAQPVGTSVPAATPTPPPSEDHLTVAEVAELSKDNKPEAVIAQLQQSNSKYSPQEVADLEKDKTVDPSVVQWVKTNAAASL